MLKGIGNPAWGYPLNMKTSILTISVPQKPHVSPHSPIFEVQILLTTKRAMGLKKDLNFQELTMGRQGSEVLGKDQWFSTRPELMCIMDQLLPRAVRPSLTSLSMLICKMGW